MRESASRHRKKYSSGIVGEDCSLEKYDFFLENAGIGKTLRELVREIVERKGSARVLDIGCGSGKALWELKKEFGERIWVCGVDLVKPRFALDKKIVGDALEEKFPQKMDLVLSFRAMHEVGMPEKVLGKTCASLERGGKAFLSSRATKYQGGKLSYAGKMRPEDIDFLETVVEEKHFGECIARGKVVYQFEEGTVGGKSGTVAFVGGINVFLEKPAR